MSRCGRCLADISPSRLDEFLKNDHLCRKCRRVSDSQYWDSLVQRQKAERPDLVNYARLKNRIDEVNAKSQLLEFSFTEPPPTEER